MLDRLRSCLSTNPEKYDSPMKNETLERYSKRMLRNFHKHWGGESSGENGLYLSPDCNITFDLRKTKRNSNTLIFGATPEEWKKFIHMQLCFVDANFIIPDFPEDDIEWLRQELKDEGYVVKVVTDPTESLDEFIQSVEKFVIIYNIRNDEKHKLIPVNQERFWWAGERFLSSQDVFFSHLLVGLFEHQHLKMCEKIPFRNTIVFYVPGQENQISDFERWLSICKACKIHFVLSVPSLNYLEQLDSDNAPIIYGNCDWRVVYDLKEEDVAKHSWNKFKGVMPVLPTTLKEEDFFLSVKGFPCPILTKKLLDLHYIRWVGSMPVF